MKKNSIIEPDIIQRTKNILEFTFAKIFETLDSEWKEKEFFKEHGNYVKPVESSTTISNPSFLKNSSGHSEITKDKTKKIIVGHFIPMKEKLEILLSTRK